MKLALEFPAVVSAIRRIADSGDRLYKRFFGILPPGVFPVLLEHAVPWVKFSLYGRPGPPSGSIKTLLFPLFMEICSKPLRRFTTNLRKLKTRQGF
jgi:hypothetical protein